MYLIKLTILYYCYHMALTETTHKMSTTSLTDSSVSSVATSSISPTVTNTPPHPASTTDITSSSTSTKTLPSTTPASTSPTSSTTSTVPTSTSSTSSTSVSTSTSSTSPTSGTISTVPTSTTSTSPTSGTTSTVPTSPSTSSTSSSSTVPIPTSSASVPTTSGSSASVSSTSGSSASVPSTSHSSTAPTSASSPSLTSTSSSSPLTTSVQPTFSVRISETNLLIDSVNPFLELEGPKNLRVPNVKLIIQSASIPPPDSSKAKSLEDTFNAEGFLVISNFSDFTPNIKHISDLTSVLIVLYKSSSNEILDSLLYSTKSNRNISEAVKEQFKIQYNLIFDPDLAKDNRSFSRCSKIGSSESFVLTNKTQNENNMCNLTLLQELKMKMTSNTIMTPCKNELPDDFDEILKSQIISSINEKQPCGLSLIMIKEFSKKWECSDKTQEISVSFKIASAFNEQLSQVKIGYQSFLSDKFIKVGEKVWYVEECKGSCVPSIKPPKNDDDDKIRVTVAVVVSCIGVFLIVLIAVVVYMKNKRHRILQFRMTRLDDDEDDLIGDMDDFVGNQGPTFRTFR